MQGTRLHKKRRETRIDEIMSQPGIEGGIGLLEETIGNVERANLTVLERSLQVFGDIPCAQLRGARRSPYLQEIEHLSDV